MIAQTNLLRQGTLSYSGGWWSANLLAQSYQTLQDPSLPLVAAEESALDRRLTGTRN